jgi:hypothetical protein
MSEQRIDRAVLVFQAGIANVFALTRQKDDDGIAYPGAPTLRRRVLQCDFQTASTYCRGLRDAGAKVRCAWCNECGDIIERKWSFNFDEHGGPPFSTSVRIYVDFETGELR